MTRAFESTTAIESSTLPIAQVPEACHTVATYWCRNSAISVSVVTFLPGKSSSPTSTGCIALAPKKSLPRLMAWTTTSTSPGLLNQPGLMCGASIVSVEAMETYPRESGVISAIETEAYCCQPLSCSVGSCSREIRSLANLRGKQRVLVVLSC
jgi:hypothetical protein